MTLYPEVQKRAQKEIDSLLSSSSARAESRMDPASTRRPGLSDREKLPYVSALVKEVWRWNPSVPPGAYGLGIQLAARVLVWLLPNV